MRGDIWTQWLEYLNDGFRMQKRQVFASYNAPSHYMLYTTTLPCSQPNALLIISPTVRLSNFRIHYIPPNTTSHLQPLNAGIVRSFKAKYKQCYCRHILKQVESKFDTER